MRQTFAFALALTVVACGESEPAPTAPVAPAPAPVASAPEVAEAPAEAAAERPPARPTFLYEIPGEPNASYLFGSLEGGTTLRESFPSEYEAIFRFARVLVVESAATDGEQAALIMDQMSHARPLDVALGAEHFTQLSEQIGDQIPPQLLGHLTPELAFLMLEGEVMADAHGGSPRRITLSPAHDLTQRRQTVAAAVVGLDSTSDVRRTFSRMRAGGALAGVTALLDHLDEQRALARTTMDAYRSGDEVALAEALVTPSTGMATLEATVHAIRRESLARWMPIVERELTEGNALIVLPIDTVLGEDGAVARLTRSGHTLRRVEVEAQ